MKPTEQHLANQQPFEHELAVLIVDTLQLEIDPSEIHPDDALFNAGLGLDSIDALELVLAVSKTYGVSIKADDERNGRVFASLRSFAAHISQKRK